MQKDIYNIPSPQKSNPLLAPDLLFVPFVAVDEDNYRLGQGGGYYDYTISQLRKSNPELQTFGVGYK